MGELLGLLGVLAGLYFLVSPAVTLVLSLGSKKRVEELEGRIFQLEVELRQLRNRPPIIERQISAPPAPRQLPAPIVEPRLPPVERPLPAPIAEPRLPPDERDVPVRTVDSLTGPRTTLPQFSVEPFVPDEKSASPSTDSAETPTHPPSISDELASLRSPLAPTPSEPVDPILLSAKTPTQAAKPTPTVEPTAPLPLPPPAPPELVPPPPANAGFDVEKLLGVRGAAWLGAIALAIAGTLFAKYSIENNLISPELRIAMLIVTGLAALIASEWPLRPRYVPTANSVAGAGIAVLYSALYAGHSLYGLFGTKLTFALMILTTVVAALMSMRYNAMFIAGLGLVGGFATPVLLSQNQDRPVALFLYILLLDVGFLAMAVRRGWHALTLLSLLLTLGIEGGWLVKQLSPEKLSIGVGFSTLFALIYLALPSVAKHLGPQEKSSEAASQNQTLLVVGAVGGLAPFMLALYLGGAPKYLPQWPLLYGYLACLNVALVAVAVLRGEATLLIAGAVATVVVQSTANLLLTEKPASMWPISLATLGLVLLPNLAGRLDELLKRWRPPEPAPAKSPAKSPEWSTLPEIAPRSLLEAAGLIGIFGFCVYLAVLLARLPEESPWLFWSLFAALFLLFAERGRPVGLPFVISAGGFMVSAFALARVIAATDARDPLSTGGSIVPREFAAPLLFAVAFGALSSYRTLRAKSDDVLARANAKQTELAGILGVLFGYGGLFYALTSPQLSGNPWPLLMCLVLYNVLLFCVALRQNWTALLPLSLCSSALLVSFWHGAHYARGDIGYALLVYGGFVLAFLSAPLGLVYLRRRAWQGRRGPYLTSALAGPLFFFVVYHAVTHSIGKAAIGLLPLFFAFLSVLGLVAVQRLPKIPPEWLDKDIAARRLLGNRALFSAVALAFITLAVPLQLDRQWVLVAWALEAAAVMRLFQRLPHPGLKYFGVALFALVAFRLLLDKDVLHMQARGIIVLNWLLYTYGVPAACFILGSSWLRSVEVEKHDPWERQLYGEKPRLSTGISFIGLILIFALINLEIADAFSKGEYVEFKWERDYARDLVTSLAWALYAVALLLVGMWRQNRALRFVSLGFLVLTIAKVFLFDLSNLRGVYRPLSFLGLALSLILVSLLYQRFVFQKDKKGSADVR